MSTWIKICGITSVEDAVVESPRGEYSAGDDAIDEPFATVEETTRTDAVNEGVLVAEAVELTVEGITTPDVESVATETVSEPSTVENRQNTSVFLPFRPGNRPS